MSSCHSTLEPDSDSVFRHKNLITITGAAQTYNVERKRRNQMLQGKDVNMGFLGESDERQRRSE
jgi:hypothetical protein